MNIAPSGRERSRVAHLNSIGTRRKAATHARVLVVDDDENALGALEKALLAGGFAVSTARDGETALAEALRVLPDVVLTDLYMPRMDGLELCSRLHEIDDDLPVIIITAEADMQSVIESMRERAEDFLTKPVEIETVLWRVERAAALRTAKIERGELRRALHDRLVAHAEAETQQRAQLGALLDKLTEGVVIADPSGRVVMINDAARDILGFRGHDPTVGALSSLEVFDLGGRCLDEESRPLVRGLTGESFTDYEVVCVRANGDRRRVLSTGTSLRDADDKITLAIVVFRDITEQRNVEQQRAEYLSLISHDLRNPLNVVLMSLSLLKEPETTTDGPSSRAFRAHLAERADRNAKRMTAMLEEITEATGLESQEVALRRVACDLRNVVDNVIDSMDDARARRVKIETDDSSPHVILGDPTRLERVVANLVTNALKYSAEDASVTIRLARRKDDVALEVIDRGIGIDPASVKLLFERYYRAPGGQARASGLGLGLYIARLIVEAHGGRIEVASEAGVGSTFKLLLPWYAAP